MARFFATCHILPPDADAADAAGDAGAGAPVFCVPGRSACGAHRTFEFVDDGGVRRARLSSEGADADTLAVAEESACVSWVDAAGRCVLVRFGTAHGFAGFLRAWRGSKRAAALRSLRTALSRDLFFHGYGAQASAPPPPAPAAGARDGAVAVEGQRCPLCGVCREGGGPAFALHDYMDVDGSGMPVFVCVPCLDGIRAARARAQAAGYLYMPGETTEELCCLCAAGGPHLRVDLVMCANSACPRAFCLDCIPAILDEDQLQRMLDEEDWLCPSCTRAAAPSAAPRRALLLPRAAAAGLAPAPPRPQKRLRVRRLQRPRPAEVLLQADHLSANVTGGVLGVVPPALADAFVVDAASGQGRRAARAADAEEVRPPRAAPRPKASAKAPSPKAPSPKAPNPRAANPRAANPRAANPRAAKPGAAKPGAAKPRGAGAKRRGERRSAEAPELPPVDTTKDEIDFFATYVNTRDEPAYEESRETDDACFLCKDGGSLIECDYGVGRHYRCRKVYHEYCLSFEVPDDAVWHCPYHLCATCGRDGSLHHCRYCPNAFCQDHVPARPASSTRPFACDACLEKLQKAKDRGIVTSWCAC